MSFLTDLVLPNIGLDVDLDRQIKLLRSITSILFTCLKQLAFIDVGDSEPIPHFELIDNIIGWIMCIVSPAYVSYIRGFKFGR